MLRALPTFLACVSLASLVGCATVSPDTPYDVASLSPAEQEEAALMERFRALELPFTDFAAISEDNTWRVGDELLYGIEYSQGDDPDERITWILGLRVESNERGPHSLFFIDQGRVLTPEEEDRREELLEGRELRIIVSGGFPFEMTLTGGTEEIREKKLRYTSDTVMFSTTIYDARGQEVERTLCSVPSDYLETDLSGACALALAEAAAEQENGGARERTLEEAEPNLRVYGRALAALLSIFQVLRENEVLEPILWKVVEKPSLLSIATNLGVNVSVSPQLEKADLDPRPLSGRPPGECIHRFPLQFVVNGGVALRTNLSVVGSRFPLRVGAGMLAADGVNPKDPSKRVSVRLLASRRGGPEQKNLPAN